MVKKALITGITGQDGSYLAELLVDKGYEVYGLLRRSSLSNLGRIKSLVESGKVNLFYGDLTDPLSMSNAIWEILPDEIYNLGAQSHVRVSFDSPEYTFNVNTLGVLRILESVKEVKERTGRIIKVYQASTSEMFGKVKESPQREDTPFHPRSPYGCSKVGAYWLGVNYRESYGLFVCNGILFNHESPRRGEEFVTRKITRAVANIKNGRQKILELGNLDAKRDWGHAKDYVEAMWLMLQQEKPDDFVVATGESHSVREFLEAAFETAGIEIESNGKSGIEEEYLRKDTREVVVRINPKFYRPAEVSFLLGDYSKARSVLKWEPKIKFNELVREMVEEDIKQKE